MKRLLSCLVLVAVLPLAGCDLYFGGSDDDQCLEPPGPEQGHRNPNDGACEQFTSNTCGGGGVFDAIAFDWGDCPSACEPLGEADCLASPDCHATYVDCAPGGDCHGDWMFNQCWDLPPSGGNYGPALCAGADADSCTRNADCVANYHVGDPTGGPGPLAYDSCAPEAADAGCFSQADCPAGTVCTAETECLPPPGCVPGQPCPDVCWGHCVLPPDSCATVDCEAGFHCEEQCTACNPMEGPCDPTCAPACVPDGPPPVCDDTACMAGTHCEVECTVDASGQVHCAPTCVPDADGCAAVTCPVGSTCVETCVPPPPECMGGPIGCPPICATACVPDQPATCAAQQTQAACEAVAGCEPVFIATCTANPDGTFNCTFAYDHCQDQGAPPPLPPMP